MITVTTEAVPASLRGHLRNWLIEVQTGVFVGNVTKMVRDELWQIAQKEAKEGSVCFVWNSNNEQGFKVLLHNNRRRHVIDQEGYLLAATEKTENT